MRFLAFLLPRVLLTFAITCAKVAMNHCAPDSISLVNSGLRLDMDSVSGWSMSMASYDVVNLNRRVIAFRSEGTIHLYVHTFGSLFIGRKYGNGRGARDFAIAQN